MFFSHHIWYFIYNLFAFNSGFQLFLCSKSFSQISEQFCLPFLLCHKYISSSQQFFFLISIFHLSFIKFPFFFVPGLASMLSCFLNTSTPSQCFRLFIPALLMYSVIFLLLSFCISLSPSFCFTHMPGWSFLCFLFTKKV